jgi:hypothetical protein
MKDNFTHPGKHLDEMTTLTECGCYEKGGNIIIKGVFEPSLDN